MEIESSNLGYLLNYKRINICGCPASGKSTLSNKISSLIQIPVYDLDDLLYNENCRRKNIYDTSKSISEILKMESFIIDGTYLTSFEERMNELDLVVLIESRSITCFLRFIWRLIIAKRLKCGERLTWKTFVLIISFNFITRKKIIEISKKYRKKIIFYKNNSLKIM